MTQDEIIEMATKVYGECDWHESALHHLEAFAKLVADKYEQKIQDLEDMITELQERQE